MKLTCPILFVDASIKDLYFLAVAGLLLLVHRTQTFLMVSIKLACFFATLVARFQVFFEGQKLLAISLPNASIDAAVNS